MARSNGTPVAPLEDSGRNALRVVLFLFLVVISVIDVFPFVWMLSASLQSTSEILSYPPTLVPKAPQWLNYLDVFRQQPFGRFYLNTLLMALAQLAGVLVSSSLAAYAFAKIPFFGRNAIFVGYLATLMIPFQVIVIPLYLMMKSVSWINTYPGLIVPGMTSVFGTFLLREFFRGIPKELEDSARMDGASHVVIYSRIVVPLSLPAMSALSIFSFMGSWDNFLWPLVVTNSPDMRTLTVGLTMFIGEYAGQTQWNVLMAASLMISLPVIIFFLIFQKGFIEGVALTGIKG